MKESILSVRSSQCSTMTHQDWHVSQQSYCLVSSQTASAKSPIVPYRLYRFLTDLEEILLTETDDAVRLQEMAPLVRHLLNNSPWIELQFSMPNPDTGWSVNTLYDEPEYPLTVQMVTWAPGMTSSIHNHGTWGLVAILSGTEKNRFWQAPETFPSHREGMTDAPQKSPPGGLTAVDQTNKMPQGALKQTGEKVLEAGDIITFMPDAIHQIEVLGDEPVISFNLYGETDFEQRFKFAPATGDAKLF